MADKDSIRVVNLLIRDFIVRHNNDSNISPVGELVKTRFAAKFEEPDNSTKSRRREDAWSRWIGVDEGLPSGNLLGPYWAKARQLCHAYLADYRLGELSFTDGSSFEPSRGRTSVSDKLTAKWTITADCFDLFASMSYNHRAIKAAVKKRFTSYCIRRGWNERTINKRLYIRYSTSKDIGRRIHGFKLFCIVTFVNGNRWSTVPKNNDKDRSICLEPLCNMLVQRAVGLGIRKCLSDTLGIDLDDLADVHRLRISDPKVATIDLSDCSDTISLRLVNYLLPYRVLKHVLASRSDMTLGPDDNYYFVNKVSSMGNGFTFDLMSIILTALTRSVDISATVFGDDIICLNEHADTIIDSLVIAGFVPNKTKTLIRSSYRESCGSHYIDGVGYITSFSMKWIEDQLDLIVTCNKVAVLASIYGEPYESLRVKIWKTINPALLGCAGTMPAASSCQPPTYILDTYIRYGPQIPCVPPYRKLKRIRKAISGLQLKGTISCAIGFTKRNRLTPSRRLRSSQWNLFFQYIQQGRLSHPQVRLCVKTVQVAKVGEDLVDLDQLSPR